MSQINPKIKDNFQKKARPRFWNPRSKRIVLCLFSESNSGKKVDYWMSQMNPKIKDDF